jgi:hypothetical protein
MWMQLPFFSGNAVIEIIQGFYLSLPCSVVQSLHRYVWQTQSTTAVDEVSREAFKDFLKGKTLSRKRQLVGKYHNQSLLVGCPFLINILH